MGLWDALNLPEQGVLSLVGGGGKSTLLLRLTGELTAAGRKTVVVTTTHMTRVQGEAVGFLLLSGDPDSLRAALAEHPAVCAAERSGDGKLAPPSAAVLRAAPAMADWVLAEADGSRGLPVKIPAPHEPVLLPGGFTAAVAGLSALGRPLTQVCHRPELAAELLGVSVQTVLTPLLMARLLTSEQGQRKGVGDLKRFRVVLNQADTAPDLAKETAIQIRRLLPDCHVIVAALREDICVKEVFAGC